ncbi:hypothetical protein GCM10010277_69460 [Streptomyces longisporoflavus]|uniref:hypothetical protein n=1 Tax=Streptomyces longisporoflavus TaxID=28044 RepID=UPI00167CAE00|nr:hypothetical protein [Streptomyces longisporoflavus]GGV63354.1 hypothetical protein GCM10010277_69460 [Streptomyces longisporoflavus]
MRKRGLLVSMALGSALVVGGLAGSAQAAPVTAQAASAPAHESAAGPVKAAGWYLYDYYFWKSECTSRGRMGKENGWWTRYECRSGSWVPGDDYELWVYS